MTHYLSPSSNRKYRPSDFNTNGFYIGMFDAASGINFDLLRTNIVDSKIFADEDVSWALFNNEHDAGEVDEGRNQVSIAAFKKKHKVAYCDIFSDINVISNKLVARCNSDLGYDIDPKNSIPTILETTEKNSDPQLMHVDMGYDKFTYHEQLLCLIALQGSTYFRVVRGSHSFNTLQDLQDNKNHNSQHTSSINGTTSDSFCESSTNGFMIPAVVTLQQGEFIVMHPKLFHSGWTADGHNIRLHFYFGLKQIKLSSNRKTQKQAETYIMQAEIARLFNGEARKNHIKNLTSSVLKKKKDAKVKKAKRFESKFSK